MPRPIRPVFRPEFIQRCSCHSTTTSPSTRKASTPRTCATLPRRTAFPGVTVNAHSTEVASCSFDEKRRVMEIAAEEVGDRLPIVHGVWADGSLEAARIAKAAQAGGASALLVFPPGPFTLGQNAEMAIAHFRRIADAAPDLPVIAFQYPLPTGQGYPQDTLLELVEAVPRSAPSKTGPTTCSSTSGRCAPCRACRGR